MAKCRLSCLLLACGLLSACAPVELGDNGTGDAEASSFAADPAAFTMLLSAELSDEGVTALRLDDVFAPNDAVSVGVPGFDGEVHVRLVDTQAQTRLAEGRLADGRSHIDEDLREGAAPRGRVVRDSSGQIFVALPVPPSADARITFAVTKDDGSTVERAFALALNAAGDTVFVETELVDDAEWEWAPAPSTEAQAALAGRVEALGKSLCGNGTRNKDAKKLGFLRWGKAEQCDDGNRSDGDGCSSDCRFEATHIAGVKNLKDSLSIVFVPVGWDDLKDFHAQVKRIGEGFLAYDWFSEHASTISVWAMMQEGRVNERRGKNEFPTPEEDERWDACETEHGAATCRRKLWPICGARSADREWLLKSVANGARYQGRKAAPTQVVWLQESDCRANAWLGSMAMGTTSDLDTFVHEMGHSFGKLADEYGRSKIDGCSSRARRGNVSEETPAWGCHAELVSEDDARCPDGSPVGAYPVGGDCEDNAELTPCAGCVMRSQWVVQQFCPVCRDHLTMRMRVLTGDLKPPKQPGLIDGALIWAGFKDAPRPLTKWTDRDCGCTPVACGSATGQRECGGDGCFGSCGDSCASGVACENNRCYTPPPADCSRFRCTDDLGINRCGGERGYLRCDSRSMRSCECDPHSATQVWRNCRECVSY